MRMALSPASSASSSYVGYTILQGAQVEDVKKIQAQESVARESCSSNSLRLLTFLTYPLCVTGAADTVGCWGIPGICVAGAGICWPGSACVMPRIALSICGRNICPRGVLKKVLGRDLICSGILFPRRNMDKSWVKLLQLCINRSYDC